MRERAAPWSPSVRSGESIGSGSSSNASIAAAAQPAFGQRLGHGGFVDHLAARGVDDDGIRLHQPNLALAQHVAGLLGQNDMEGDHVGLP